VCVGLSPSIRIVTSDIAVGGPAAWTVTLTLIHDGMVVNGGTVANGAMFVARIYAWHEACRR